MSRNRAFVIVLASAVLVAGCLSSKAAERQRLRARNSYERALGYIAERQAALALTSLQEAIELDPKVAIYHDTLGMVYLDLRRVDQAVAELKKATEIDPNRGDSFFHLGSALAEGRRWEEAVSAYRKALNLPSLTVADYAHQNLGLALFHLKRYREAEEALRFALSLDPTIQAAYYNLGLVLAVQNRPDEAKASFRKARQLSPDSPFGEAALERLRAMGEGS
ncbi:MAG TPA: tetratricopeptide repeat protein [Methylomirabilota bacterium]|nr:tetratricopeptide repeat protein [Methylomirabilota bacterium]